VSSIVARVARATALFVLGGIGIGWGATWTLLYPTGNVCSMEVAGVCFPARMVGMAWWDLLTVGLMGAALIYASVKELKSR
jgi:hypothetical protein